MSLEKALDHALIEHTDENIVELQSGYVAQSKVI